MYVRKLPEVGRKKTHSKNMDLKKKQTMSHTETVSELIFIATAQSRKIHSPQATG